MADIIDMSGALWEPDKKKLRQYTTIYVTGFGGGGALGVYDIEASPPQLLAWLLDDQNQFIAMVRRTENANENCRATIVVNKNYIVLMDGAPQEFDPFVYAQDKAEQVGPTKTTVH